MALLTADRDRFLALVAEHYGGAFVWGHSDCAMAAVAVWHGMGLPDAGQAVRGRYSDAQGRRAMGRVEDRAAEIFVGLGWPEISVSEAVIGDAGIVGRWLALRLEESWIAKAKDGAIEYAPEDARRAWRVPL